MTDLMTQLRVLDGQTADAALVTSTDRLTAREVPTTRAQWLAYLTQPWKRPANAAVLQALREGIARQTKADERRWTGALWLGAGGAVSAVVTATALFHAPLLGLSGLIWMAGVFYWGSHQTPYFADPRGKAVKNRLNPLPVDLSVVGLAQRSSAFAGALRGWMTDGVGLLQGDLDGLEPQLATVREAQRLQQEQEVLAQLNETLALAGPQTVERTQLAVA